MAPESSALHYPPHASWMNMAECLFRILTRQALTQSELRSKKELNDFLIRFLVNVLRLSRNIRRCHPTAIPADGVTVGWQRRRGCSIDRSPPYPRSRTRQGPMVLC